MLFVYFCQRNLIMVADCAVAGCSNSGGCRPNLSFHQFPKCAEMRALWVEVINRSGWTPSPYSKVCSDHFEEKDYSSEKKLRIDAVPSLYPVPKVQHVSETNHDVHTTISEVPSTIIICGNGVVLESNLEEPEIIIPNFVSSTYSNPLENNSHLQEIVDQKPNINKIILDSNFSYSNITENNSHLQEIVDEQPYKNESVLNLKSKSLSVGTQTFTMIKNKDREGPQKAKILHLKSKITNLQRNLRRKDKKLKELKELLKQTKAQIPDSKNNIHKLIEENLSGFLKDLVAQELSFTDKVKTHRKYNENVKEFATTLYSFSPKAYEFVTNFMNLPNSTSIRSWLTEINYDSSSNLQSENKEKDNTN